MGYANCPVAQYHKMKVVSSPYNHDITSKQVEKCTACGNRIEYEFDFDKKDVKDQRKYFLDHIRDFAQPVSCSKHDDTCFEVKCSLDPDMMEAFLYCNPKVAERLKKWAKQDKRSATFQAEMTEKGNWALKRALENKGFKDKGDIDGIDRSVSDHV